MIYPTRGQPWSELELRDMVECLMAREKPEAFLGHAADAIEYLMEQVDLKEKYDNMQEALLELNEEYKYVLGQAQRLVEDIGGIEKCLNTLTRP